MAVNRKPGNYKILRNSVFEKKNWLLEIQNQTPRAHNMGVSDRKW